MTKKRKVPKRRSPGAHALEDPLFRHRVVLDKKKAANRKLSRKVIRNTADDNMINQ